MKWLNWLVLIEWFLISKPFKQIEHLKEIHAVENIFIWFPYQHNAYIYILTVIVLCYSAFFLSRFRLYVYDFDFPHFDFNRRTAKTATDSKTRQQTLRRYSILSTGENMKRTIMVFHIDPKQILLISIWLSYSRNWYCLHKILLFFSIDSDFFNFIQKVTMKNGNCEKQITKNIKEKTRK